MQQPDGQDLSGLRFDSDEMQVLSVSRRERDLTLPLVRGPINFTVIRSDAKFSNRWGVVVEKRGDAYIYCRDNPDAEKVSLHASGQQHVSIRRDVAESIGAESRFGNRWNEPEFDTEAVPTFTLVFPPWGVGLERAEFPANITKDELLIVGHPEKVIVVAFFVVDSERNMRGRVSNIALGRLPLKEGKTLHVIAWKEPQGDLMNRIRQAAFPAASARCSQLDLENGEYTMSVQGYRRRDSAYMVVFPVRYAPHESAGSPSTLP